MAATKGNAQSIIIGGIELDAETASVQMNLETSSGDETNLASTAMESIPILTSGSVDVNGYFGREDAYSLAEKLHSAAGTVDGVAYIPDRTLSAAITSPAYVIAADSVRSGM